jgi:hypothetical protein
MSERLWTALGGNAHPFEVARVLNGITGGYSRDVPVMSGRGNDSQGNALSRVPRWAAGDALLRGGTGRAHGAFAPTHATRTEDTGAAHGLLAEYASSTSEVQHH